MKVIVFFKIICIGWGYMYIDLNYFFYYLNSLLLESLNKDICKFKVCGIR